MSGKLVLYIYLSKPISVSTVLNLNLNLTCTLLQSMKIIMRRRGLLVRGSVHHVIERISSGKMKSLI